MRNVAIVVVSAASFSEWELRLRSLALRSASKEQVSPRTLQGVNNGAWAESENDHDR